MTSATDRLARARAELAAAERMGSPEVDVARAAVEQAEQAVVDERGGCPVCGCETKDCEDCIEDCQDEGHPCGHPRMVRGCGGCDPGAIALILSDAQVARIARRADADEEEREKALARWCPDYED